MGVAVDYSMLQLVDVIGGDYRRLASHLFVPRARRCRAWRMRGLYRGVGASETAWTVAVAAAAALPEVRLIWLQYLCTRFYFLRTRWFNCYLTF